ncbi:FAD-linked oxidoreductase [Trametes polyzona]|nr:FAD-linked oxidoreductase [Trametes polyzona]
MSLPRAAKLFPRFAACRPPPPILRARGLATPPPPGLSPPRTKFLSARRIATIGIVSSTLLGTALLAPVVYADATAADGTGKAGRSSQAHDGSGSASKTPLSALVRTYVVYSLCSIPALVDWSPAILSTLLAIPGVRKVTEAVVRYTFFNQFVGGDSAEEALPVLEQLRAENKGVLFVYSVEVDETAPGSAGPQAASAHKQIVDETLHCIDVAADFEDRHASGDGGKGTWVAIKLSAMVPDAEALRRLSKYLVDTRPPTNPRVAFPGCPRASDLDVLSTRPAPGASGTLTEADIAALCELRDDLAAICERARARGIRITVDAEHSWYQPAIDAFTLDMMRKFNKLPSPRRRSWFGQRQDAKAEEVGTQPLIYNTFQGYLRRTPEYLAQSIADARAGGYALGVKLVRGAYHPHEIEVHKAATQSRMDRTTPSGSHELSISPDNMPPVWLRKDETDTCYNEAVQLLVRLVREDAENVEAKGAPGPTIGALFGTHNWESADLVIDELVRQGLATKVQGEKGESVWISDAAMKRVAVAQLYGMCDALTDHLVSRTRTTSPFVLKYLPYGSLAEVMPYLSRRAIENKSVLGNGGAASERKRAASEIWARIFG